MVARRARYESPDVQTDRLVRLRGGGVGRLLAGARLQASRRAGVRQLAGPAQVQYGAYAKPTALGTQPAASVEPQAGTPAADIGWREFFRDPRLQRLIELSLANNRDLRVAVQRVEERARAAARRAVAQHRRRHPGPAPAPARQHAGAGRWLDQQQLPGRHRPDHVRDRPVRPVAQPVRGGVPAVPVDRAGAEERAHHAGGLGRAGLFQPARGRGPDGPDPAHAGLAPGVLQPGQAPLRRRCVVRAGLESGQDLAGFGLVQPGRAGPRARKPSTRWWCWWARPCPRTCPRRPRSAANSCWPRCRRDCRPTCWSAGPTSSPPSTSSSRPMPISARRARRSSRPSP